MNHEKYSSIGQFRNVIKDVQYIYGEGVLPTLKFTGTVKAHGNNVSVVINKDNKQYTQSRTKVITEQDDLNRFSQWHSSKKDTFKNFYDMIGIDKDIIIYGEWCGKGIQKGVAISECDKFFYIFGVKVLNHDGSHCWISDCQKLHSPEHRIFDSRKVCLFDINIDFNDPKSSQNELIRITNDVEKECPIGKYLFDISGIGEGVVWEHINDKGEKLSFKVKGEKHSVTKVKKLAEVDTEKLTSIREFIDYAVNENRLEQGFKEACDNKADKTKLGKFIKWVSTDVLKEEQDTMKANDLIMKDIGSALSNKSKSWFFDKL